MLRRINPLPFTRVLVGVDFTKSSDAAVRRAVHLPLARGAVVELVHVLPTRPPPFARNQEELAWDALRKVEARALRMARTRGRMDVELRTGCARGEVAELLSRQCRAESAGLLVLGRGGLRALKDELRGTMPERLLRTGSAPVLVVGHSSAQPYRRPLVALDFQQGSEEVLRAAVAVAPAGKAPMRILNAFESGQELLLRQTEPTVGRVTAWKAPGAPEVKREAEDLLMPFVGLRGRFRLVLHPDEPEEAATARTHTDLLVLGTHARKGASRLLLGSVSGRALREARCDVLVVPAPAHSASLASFAQP